MPSLGKIAFVLVSFYLLLRFLPAIPISSTVTQKQDLFTVEGTGKVTTVPDTGIVSVGVLVNSATVKSAQTRANEVVNKITQAITNLGIDTKDIKTTNYSIYPQYDYSAGNAARIVGYQVNINLNITVKDIDKINQVVDTSTANGANTVSGIQLTVNDERQKQLVQQAREEAVKEAKSKAESLASAAGIRLGRIINIQETGTPAPEPRFLAEKAIGLGGGGDTQIQPGSTDITSTITLTYETR